MCNYVCVQIHMHKNTHKEMERREKERKEGEGVTGRGREGGREGGGRKRGRNIQRAGWSYVCLLIFK